MFITPCSECAFCDHKNKKCNANQMMDERSGQFITPGFCRIFTEKSKYDKDISLTDNIYKAVSKADFCKSNESIVIFDETENTIADLDRTIDSFHDNMNSKNVRILHINPKNNALLIKYSHKRFKIFVTVVLEKLSQIEQYIDVAIKGSNAVYQTVLRAGMTLNNSMMLSTLTWPHNRCVFWYFPIQRNLTLMHEPNIPFGIYIKQSYIAIGGTSSDDTGKITKFLDKLNTIAKNTGINLTWMIDGCSLGL